MDSKGVHSAPRLETTLLTHTVCVALFPHTKPQFTEIYGKVQDKVYSGPHETLLFS